MSKETRAKLIAELLKVQNNGKNDNQDIMTITGFMKTEREIRAHIEANR